MRICVFAGLAFGWCLATTGRAGAITLVRDGVPAATIVIRDTAFNAKPYTPHYPDDIKMTADAKVRRAADDLQLYIQKMSGARLPIVSDLQAVNGPVVLVGASRRTAERHLDIPHGETREHNEEGYLISAHGDTLALAGNEDGHYWGTYYAVAELLNRLGMRWYMPGDFGEVVPHLATVSYADGDFRDRPDFRLRTWWGYAPHPLLDEEWMWKLRNKMMIEMTMPNSGDSSVRQWMPAADLAKTHPEYFAKNQDGSLNLFFPNLSNPDMPRMIAAKMAAYLDETKKTTGTEPEGVSISPDDGMPRDFRPESVQLNQGFTETVGREGEPSEMSISEEWFGFVNKVAGELAKIHPDTIVATNGYANRQEPPEGVKLAPNIMVLYASIWADTLKAFDNPRSWHGALQAAMLKRWGELCPRVDLYRYNYAMLTSSLTPIPMTRKLAHDMPLYKRDGIIGFFDENKPATYMEQGIPTFYIRARTEWNANLDVDSTLNEYFHLWYGPAAAPAHAFWDALEEAIETTPYLGHEDRILPDVYTPVLMATLERRVAEAEKLADVEPYKTRVAIDRHILEHLKHYEAYCAAEAAADYDESVRQMDGMTAERAALHAIDGFLNQPEVGQEGGMDRYNSGTWGYGLISRRPFAQALADTMNGKKGKLVAMGNRFTAFSLDDADMGRLLRWYDPTYDRSQWRTIDTTKSFYSQGYLTPNGVPYRGAMWYVFDLDIPREFDGKPIRLYAPVVTTEAWVWANGGYAGHRGYLEPYNRPACVDLDVTALVHPGHNTIALRVSTGTNRTEAADGLDGRLWLWSPNPGATAPTAFG